MTQNPYAHQEAGTHYVNMAMQPFHFAMVNGWDAGAFSILKYLSRHRTKNGVQDLKKARHFIDLRQAEIGEVLPCRGLITMLDYIAANQLSGLDATALLYLNAWALFTDPTDRDDLIQTIEQLIAEYPTTPLP